MNNTLPSGMRSIINIMIHVAQGTLEYGVFNLNFHDWDIPGRGIPTFTGEKCEKSMVCFTVPTDHRRIQCLNVWCKHNGGFRHNPWLKIENKTKDLTWIHRST